MREIELQRRYYAETAARYGRIDGEEGAVRRFAVNIMLGASDYLGVRSLLEVGAATGNVLGMIKAARPSLAVIGIEPVDELRAEGHRNGFSQDELVEGDGTAMRFPDASFDLVCAFAMLHHVRRPEVVIGEMLRVARKAIFICDSNNFAQGSASLRFAKQLLNAVALWRVADFIKTRGKGYTISEGDGLAYSYSLFNNYEQIHRACERVHVMNAGPSAGVNHYRSAGSVLLFGIKSH